MGTNVVLIIVVLFVLITGGFGVVERKVVVGLKREVALSTTELEDTNRAVEEQEALIVRFREENDAYTKESASLREKIANFASATSVAEPAANTSSNSFEDNRTRMYERMSKDPKRKEIVRQWHEAKLKHIYGDFVRDRGLSLLQTQQFFDLLSKESERARNEYTSLVNGDEDDAVSNGSLAPPLELEKADIDRQLGILLGDDNYSAYRYYKRSASDRLTLLQFREQLARTSNPLRDEQAGSLLEVILEERASYSYPGLAFQGPSFQNMTHQEQFTELLESNYSELYHEFRRDLNLRILDRVHDILSPDQYDEFQDFQDQQLELDTVRMDVAREMMEQRKSSAPSSNK